MVIARFFFKIVKIFPKVTLHPLFLGYLCVLFFCGAESTAVLSLLAVILHELGHVIVAKRVGVSLGEVVMYPFGAVMCEEGDEKNSSWKVAIAGPIASLCFAVLGALMLLVAKSEFWAGFLNANLTIALFNLLPAYPLDGARAIIYSSPKPIRATKILRLSGIIISFVLFALLLLGTFLGKSNPSFGLLGAFLLIGALNGVEREMSARIAKILLVKQKNYEKGLPVVKIACSENMPVHRVVSKISPDKLTEIEILYKTGDKKCVSEEDFLRFAEISSPKRAIGEI